MYDKLHLETGKTELFVRRGLTVPFEQLPARGIALDGYVQGPAVDVEGDDDGDEEEDDDVDDDFDDDLYDADVESDEN
jgi:hypothetical protein